MPRSPPARVAWIETKRTTKEKDQSGSPPARVAWIETLSVQKSKGHGSVATREGGVDRNSAFVALRMMISCRHPRGWRG